MTALNKQALRQLAEKATHGEWWSDVVETEGEYGDGEDRASGYHSYAVYVGSESLLDMTNSTAACIYEEWDHDYRMAWDETGKRNAEFIAAANPATVLALLDDLEAAEKRIAELERSETQLINERDDAESALNDAYKAVMGQAPEWSNWFSFADAIDEIELACRLWRNQTADVIQFRQRIAELEARGITVEPFRSFVTDDDLAALHRFAECCDDPESGGHDLEKEQVRRLEAIGALQRSGRISYITGFGDVLISITAGIGVKGE